jgi:hypothetical protein
MTISETKKVERPFGRVKAREAQLVVEASEERKQMESRLSLGTVICFMLAIAFGVCCLYLSMTVHYRRDELPRGLAQQYRFAPTLCTPDKDSK